ncbi:hypothetical protein [Aurantiacibacter odishensis]|uniref:hypothetical protein n=1 Tax=Aurantiacibacter odishensis TaxID=1155476 RepID=UPI000E70E362|nr:hypothetical protein [Aurantiacibacter odishensis]
MSRRLALFFVPLAVCAPAGAQQVYGPSDFESEASSDEPVPLVEAKPCEEEVREDGAIVVCRELDEAERYLSPLPRPVRSDKRHVPGLTDPPCWVTQPESLACMRVGYVPPYPPLIDVSAFPEPLSEEEAAAVSAVVVEDVSPSEVLTGERVPIDLSEEG